MPDLGAESGLTSQPPPTPPKGPPASTSVGEGSSSGQPTTPHPRPGRTIPASDRYLAVYRAIADPVRRAILDLLRSGDKTAGHLAAAFPVSRPAVSRHLRILRQAGLLVERKEGRSRRYALRVEPLGTVQQWLERYRVPASAIVRSGDRTKAPR